jgi:SsrA-binding protein
MARSSASGRPQAERVIAENRKARHDYELLETVVAGLVLLGTEVKSLRGGKGNVAEAWVRFVDDEGWLMDAHIPPYPQAHQFNHEPRRPRKLLLKARELERLRKRTAERGLTTVPLKLFFSGPWVKVELGLGKGRKLHDKRQALKEKQDRRDMDRARGRR